MEANPSLIDIIENNLSIFIRKMLKTLNRVFSKKFQDYKNKETVSTIYWGYLLKPLAKLVTKKMTDKRKKSKKDHQRYARNFEDVLLFFMHFATSTRIQMKEEKKWIIELNQFI